MKNPLSLDIKGIKCDNKACDYSNPDVSADDYINWLNKPCPKCGANLLTLEDFETVTRMIHLVNTMNRLLPEAEEGTEMVGIPIDMDGSGEIIINGERMKNDD